MPWPSESCKAPSFTQQMLLVSMFCRKEGQAVDEIHQEQMAQGQRYHRKGQACLGWVSSRR